MADWDELATEQKAELVATKVMGAIDGPPMTPLASPTWLFANRTLEIKHKYRPTEKIEQAWEVQEQIEQLGRAYSYTKHLLALCGPATRPADWVVLEWLKIKASADQRCHAAVLAVASL